MPVVVIATGNVQKDSELNINHFITIFTLLLPIFTIATELLGIAVIIDARNRYRCVRYSILF